jgi:hypothetical protein
MKKKKTKIMKKGKKLIEKSWKDPMVQEYVDRQKKLAKSTLKKAIRRIGKKI